MSIFFNVNGFMPLSEETGYPLEEGGIIELENDINEDFISVVESAYITDMEKIKYGVVMENSFKTFLSKVKEFFKKLWDKVKKFFAWIKSLFSKKTKDLKETVKEKKMIAEILPEVAKELERYGEGLDEFKAKLQKGMSSISKLPKETQQEVVNIATEIQNFVKNEMGKDVTYSEAIKDPEMLRKFIASKCQLIERVEGRTLHLKDGIYTIPLSTSVISTFVIDSQFIGVELDDILKAIKSHPNNYEDITKDISDIEHSMRNKLSSSGNFDDYYKKRFENESNKLTTSELFNDKEDINSIKEIISEQDKYLNKVIQDISTAVYQIGNANTTNEEEKKFYMKCIPFLKEVSVFMVKHSEYLMRYMSKIYDVNMRILQDVGHLLPLLK